MIRKTLMYMENDIYGPDSKHELSEEVLAECINKHKLCAFWAVIGGEILFSGWMGCSFIARVT